MRGRGHFKPKHFSLSFHHLKISFLSLIQKINLHIKWLFLFCFVYDFTAQSTILRSYWANQLTYKHCPLAGSDLLVFWPILNAYTFANNQQMPFLDQQTGDNGQRNYFMISFNKKYVAGLGFILMTPRLAVRYTANCALEPSSEFKKSQFPSTKRHKYYLSTISVAAFSLSFMEISSISSECFSTTDWSNSCWSWLTISCNRGRSLSSYSSSGSGGSSTCCFGG